MANTYKNIVITPNIGNTSDPRIQFSGGNTTVNTDINLYVYPNSNGTLSFEGAAGQLFSITNDLSNSLFNVSDVSGIPSLEVFANGLVSVVPYGGNVAIGSSGDLAFVGNAGIYANGSLGTAGQFLTSNATAVYWSAGANLASPTVIGATAANGATFTYANVTGQVNTATLRVTTTANVETIYVSNDVVTSTINTISSTTDLTLTTGNTTGSRIVVSSTNGMSFYSNSSANAAFIDANGAVFNIPIKLEMGGHTTGGYDFGNLAVIEIDQNQNTYMQIVVQNANTGNNASADLIVTNDQGNDTVNFVDLGINGSGYNQPSFNIGGAGDGYLYASNGSLAIGTANATVSNIKFHTGGTASTNERMRIDAAGNVGIGNTAPNAKLQVTGTANVSGNVVFSANAFTLGTSTNAATGYTILPNQLKMNWGVVVPNSIGGNTISFSSPFTTNAYSVTLTVFTSVVNAGAANAKIAHITAMNSSTVTIRTANNTLSVNTGVLGVHYLAIGPA